MNNMIAVELSNRVAHAATRSLGMNEDVVVDCSMKRKVVGAEVRS